MDDWKQVDEQNLAEIVLKHMDHNGWDCIYLTFLYK